MKTTVRHTLWTVAAFMVIFGSSFLIHAEAETNTTVDVQLLQDRLDIIDTINAVGYYADMNDWDTVAAQFADSVILDYTSYAEASAGNEAGDPDPLTPDEIVAAWQTVLPGYDYTQHIIGNHQVQVNGDSATAVSAVYASHFLENDGEDYWIFIGNYEHSLIRTPEGWKIDRMTAIMRAQLGNENLVALAQERVASGAAQ